MSEVCQKKGCLEEAISCRVFDHVEGEDCYEYLCPEHAVEAGYCGCCGEFSAGIDSFDFVHPGLCDMCDDAIRADLDEPDDCDGDQAYYEALWGIYEEIEAEKRTEI